MKSVMMTIALLGFLAQAVSADPSCKPIHAVQRDVLVTENCPSPIGFCAAGTITGNHGLRGTTFYSSRGFHPVPGEEPTRQVVVGTTTFTTDDGVIIIEDLSVFETVRGTFAGVAPIVEGTGRFAGATGDILTVGRVLPDGSLITDVSGEICLPE
jgi:hypothetical protein